MFKSKISIYMFLVAGITGLFASCEKEVEIPGGPLSAFNKVYMPQSGKNPNIIALKMADSAQSFVFGAHFGGYDYAPEDINVEFAVNPALADSFNRKNGTAYPLLPENSYSFTASSAVIPKGKLSTQPLHVSVNPIGKLTLFKEYILPVSISKLPNGISLEESLGTTYYIVKASLDFKDFPEYERTGWTIKEFSTQEPAEGATNGGLASCILDDKLTTFWHTKWAGGEAPSPHWVVVDLGDTRVIHGLSFVGRQSDNNGKPKDLTVSVSSNGTDWEDVGALTLQNVNSKQKYFLSSFKSARYFKINITASFGNVKYTHLAELGAF